jgi:hypothetical protein
MRGRFFAIEGDDVNTFSSREEAEDWLEAVDVRNGVYRFFFEDGTELRLRAEDSRVVVTDEAVGEFAQQLADSLRRHLTRVPLKRRRLDDTALEGASLPELVEEVSRTR